MARLDLYGPVHKGLRATLFATLARVGACDFASAAEAEEAAGAVRRLLGFLDEHAAHEDAEILPVLALLAPEVHASLRGDHARIEGLQREVESLLARMQEAPAAQAALRQSLGRRLHDALGALAAEHLLHMLREEQEGNRLLWAHRSDDELAALHARILARIPPARMALWLALLLPALPGPERAALLAGLRARVPAAAFGDLTAPARVALGEAAWARALGEAAWS